MYIIRRAPGPPNDVLCLYKKTILISDEKDGEVSVCSPGNLNPHFFIFDLFIPDQINHLADLVSANGSIGSMIQHLHKKCYLPLRVITDLFVLVITDRVFGIK